MQGINPPEAKLEYNCFGRSSISLTNNGPSDLIIDKIHLSKNINLTQVPAVPATIPNGGKFTAYYAVNDSANGLITFVTNHGPVGAIVAADRLCFTVFSPVDLHITDPAGRYTGFNKTSGFVLLGLPGTYSGPDSEPEYIIVPNPSPGQYNVEMSSTTAVPANYSLSVVRVINDTIVYQMEIKNVTIGPNETQTIQETPNLAVIKKAFKPAQIHKDRHGEVTAIVNITNTGPVDITKIDVKDEFLHDFTIKNLHTISVYLTDRNGHKHLIKKNAIIKSISNGSLYLTVDFGKGAPVFLKETEDENDETEMTTADEMNSKLWKSTKEVNPGDSLIIRYQMHPTTKKKLVIGELTYITEATVKSEGVSEILKTLSKFRITENERPESHHNEEDHEW